MEEIRCSLTPQRLSREVLTQDEILDEVQNAFLGEQSSQI